MRTVSVIRQPLLPPVQRDQVLFDPSTQDLHMRIFPPAVCAARPATVERALNPFRSLVFRPAETADADAVVPLIYSSAPAAFDFLFAVPGRGEARDFLRRAFVE